MEHNWLRRDDSSSDPDNDFESYLKKKVNECVKVPLSQLQVTPLPQEKTPAKGAEEDSKSGQSSKIPEKSEPQSSGNALSVERPLEEQGTTIAIRGVDGHKYTVQHSEPFSVDSEWIRVRNESARLAVVDMTPEQIIRRVHDLDRQVFLTRAQQQGLNDALEELLKAENSAKRAELIELRSKLTSRARGGKTEKKAKPSGSKAQKAVDSLFGLQFSQKAILETIETQGLLDESTRAYIEKKFTGGA